MQIHTLKVGGSFDVFLIFWGVEMIFRMGQVRGKLSQICVMYHELCGSHGKIDNEYYILAGSKIGIK